MSKTTKNAVIILVHTPVSIHVLVMLKAANACRFWPTGRGIYHNDAKTFLVWCNEEDHLRIISMQMGGDLGQVWLRTTNILRTEGQKLMEVGQVTRNTGLS
jgi:hypothetical protein